MLPSPPTKAAQLQNLRHQIESAVVDPWFFPPRGTVAGFSGTGPVVIVGRRPSRSSFLDEGANRLFYDVLAEFGLENSHLTNFIKSRGNKGDPDPKERAVHEAFFEQEIQIVSPPCIVVPMGDAYEQVAAFLLARGIRPFARIPQYASMNYGGAQIDAFRRAVEQVATSVRAPAR